MGGDKDVLLWHAYRRRHEATNKAPWENILLCFNYLNDIYTSEEASTQSIGFKLMYGQLRRHLFCILSYLLWNRVAIVHLVRHNFLDVILSEEAARIRNTSHTWDEVQNIQIKLDLTTLLSRIRRKERKINWARRFFSRLGLPYLEVSYEVLVATQVSFGAILEFLGIRSGYQAMNTSFKRLNRGTHRELIENYDQVAALLVGTKYAQLLD